MVSTSRRGMTRISQDNHFRAEEGFTTAIGRGMNELARQDHLARDPWELYTQYRSAQTAAPATFTGPMAGAPRPENTSGNSAARRE
jgi:hypothetical protein